MRSKKALYNISSNLILQLVVIIYGFIVPKLIIRSYGSEVNGLVSSITHFLAYITLLESGIGPVVKASLYKPLANKDKGTIVNIIKATEKFFRIISGIFILYILVLSFVYPLLVSKEFDFIFTVSLIIIISISTFAEYYFGMTYRLLIQSDQKTYVISIIQVLTYILSLLAMIILVKFNVSIHVLKLISGLIFVLRPILQRLYVKRKYNLDFTVYEKDYKLKNKWDGLAQHVASVIHSNTDVAVLTFFTNLSEVSVYSVYGIVNKGIKSFVHAFSSGVDASWGNMIAKNEKENLNNKFSLYEVLYNIVNVIVFSCTIVLIVPFISVYTNDIVDVNYIRPTFGVLIVISEYIWAIRLPYSSITLAAGHFKQTRIGAWVECMSNVIISILLVWKYGIVGVTIGTIVAMTIRTIEFVYHTNKYILERSIWISVKKILLVICETIIIVFTCRLLPYVENISYLNWVINALMVSFVASIVVFVFNFAFYKKEFIAAMKILGDVRKKFKINKKSSDLNV